MSTKIRNEKSNFSKLKFVSTLKAKTRRYGTLKAKRRCCSKKYGSKKVKTKSEAKQTVLSLDCEYSENYYYYYSDYFDCLNEMDDNNKVPGYVPAEANIKDINPMDTGDLCQYQCIYCSYNTNQMHLLRIHLKLHNVMEDECLVSEEEDTSRSEPKIELESTTARARRILYVRKIKSNIDETVSRDEHTIKAEDCKSFGAEENINYADRRDKMGIEKTVDTPNSKKYSTTVGLKVSGIEQTIISEDCKHLETERKMNNPDCPVDMDDNVSNYFLTEVKTKVKNFRECSALCPYQCIYCSYNTNRFHLLRKHLKSHIIEEVKNPVRKVAATYRPIPVTHLGPKSVRIIKIQDGKNLDHNTNETIPDAETTIKTACKNFDDPEENINSSPKCLNKINEFKNVKGNISAIKPIAALNTEGERYGENFQCKQNKTMSHVEQTIDTEACENSLNEKNINYPGCLDKMNKFINEEANILVTKSTPALISTERERYDKSFKRNLDETKPHAEQTIATEACEHSNSEENINYEFKNEKSNISVSKSTPTLNMERERYNKSFNRNLDETIPDAEPSKATKTSELSDAKQNIDYFDALNKMAEMKTKNENISISALSTTRKRNCKKNAKETVTPGDYPKSLDKITNKADDSNKVMAESKDKGINCIESINLGQYQCIYCSYNSNKKKLLVAHLQNHDKEKHKCFICERSFARGANLKMHLQTHSTGRQFECADCEKAFTTTASLARHRRYAHSGLKPIKCTDCDYSTFSRQALKVHLRVHADERPFKCTLCSYASREAAVLDIHMRTHTGEKPFKCFACEFRCSHKCSLKRHISVTHTAS